MRTLRARRPPHRDPTHPGVMLLEEYLKPKGVTQRKLADAIHVPFQRVNELVNRRRGITPSTALRLAAFFGTTAEYWMTLQGRWDLYHVQQSESGVLGRIRAYEGV